MVHIATLSKTNEFASLCGGQRPWLQKQKPAQRSMHLGRWPFHMCRSRSEASRSTQEYATLHSFVIARSPRIGSRQLPGDGRMGKDEITRCTSPKRMSPSCFITVHDGLIQVTQYILSVLIRAIHTVGAKWVVGQSSTAWAVCFPQPWMFEPISHDVDVFPNLPCSHAVEDRRGQHHSSHDPEQGADLGPGHGVAGEGVGGGNHALTVPQRMALGRVMRDFFLLVTASRSL